MSFLAELKRRKVFKVGAAYLALAWLVLQLTSIVVPAFELPAWTLKFVIWFGVIGFPCVLVFAWIYELTPEGLKRDSAVPRSESHRHDNAHRLNAITLGVGVLAILTVALDRFLPARGAHRPVAAVATDVNKGAVNAAAPIATDAAARPHPGAVVHAVRRR